MVIDRFEIMKEAVGGVRNIRKGKNIPMKDALALSVMSGDGGYATDFDAVLVKLANINNFTFVSEKVEGAVSFMVRTHTYFVPMDGLIDVAEEIAKMEKELAHQQGFLTGVMKKLSNEQFVSYNFV